MASIGSSHQAALAPAISGASPWRDPGSAGERLEIEDFPSFLLSRLGSLAKSKLTRLYLDRAELSMPEWRLLTMLAHFSPTTYPALVQRSTMDKAQISLTLRTLVARGWATWKDAASRAGTRRPSRIVAITARGRTVIKKILPEAQRAQMKLLERLSRQDRAQLHSLLQKMVVALEGLEGEGRE